MLDAVARPLAATGLVGSIVGNGCAHALRKSSLIVGISGKEKQVGDLEAIAVIAGGAVLAEIGKDAYHEIKRWNNRRHRPRTRTR